MITFTGIIFWLLCGVLAVYVQFLLHKPKKITLVDAFKNVVVICLGGFALTMEMTLWMDQKGSKIILWRKKWAKKTKPKSHHC